MVTRMVKRIVCIVLIMIERMDLGWFRVWIAMIMGIRWFRQW